MGYFIIGRRVREVKVRVSRVLDCLVRIMI